MYPPYDLMLKIHISRVLLFNVEFSYFPWSELVGFGRNLVQIVPRSLPELFKQLGDQNNSQKHSKTSDNILREK